MYQTMNCAGCKNWTQHRRVRGERLFGSGKIAAVMSCMICDALHPVVVVDADHWLGKIDPVLVIGCQGNCRGIRSHHVCLIRPTPDGRAEVLLICSDCSGETRRYFEADQIPAAMVQGVPVNSNFMPA